MFSPSRICFDTLISVCIGFIYLFCAHYFRTNIGGDGLRLPFNLAVMAGVLLLVFTCTIKVFRSFTFRITHLSFTYILLTFCLLLPVVYTNSQFLHLAKLKLYFVMLLPFIYLAFTQINKSRYRLLSNFIVISVLIEVLYGYAQLFSIGNIIDPVPGKPTGIFQQPNVFATFVVMGIHLSIYNTLTRKNNTKLEKALYIVPISIFISMRYEHG